MQNKNNSGMVAAIMIGSIVIILCGAWGIYQLSKYYAGKQADYLSQTQNTSTTACSSCAQNYYASWQTYNNNRYEFSIKLPKEYIGEESENGDGNSFVNNNNSNIRIEIFGKNNSEGITLDKYLDNAFAELQMKTKKITKSEKKEIDLDNCTGQERTWHYTDEANKEMVKQKAVCLKDNVFYVADITAPQKDYESAKSTFDDIIDTLNIK